MAEVPTDRDELVPFDAAVSRTIATPEERHAFLAAYRAIEDEGVRTAMIALIEAMAANHSHDGT